MATNKPLVSVIIPTYNRSDLLLRAIRSVLEQTYKNVECIVVDDASIDNTEVVVRQFTDDRLIYLRHETNRHASAARNTGIAYAKGDLIAFLDDDDEWMSRKLEKQVELLLSLHEKVGMVYCWMDYFDQKGNLIKEHHPKLKGYVFHDVLYVQRLGGCPTLLVRRDVVEKVGGFDETLPRGNDGDFIRRVCRQYEVDYVPESLVKVYVGHGKGRISTRLDREGIIVAIRSLETRLVKFKGELKHYPREHANILARKGYFYSLLPDYGGSLRLFLKAIRLYPASPIVYSFFKKSVRRYFSRARIE